MFKRIILTLTLVISTGIIFGQSDSTSGNNKFHSNICFLRETGYTGSARKFKIFFDGKLVGRLNNNSYATKMVQPGNHSFSVQLDGTELQESTERLELITEPNKTYYFASILEVGAFMSKTYFIEITENSALKRIKKLIQNKDF